MNSTNLINVTDINFVHRERATYEEPVVRIEFKTEEDYLFWKSAVADKHATWNFHHQKRSTKKEDISESVRRMGKFYEGSCTYRCDHSGFPPVPKAKGTVLFRMLIFII